jgi:hypothetical protein
MRRISALAIMVSLALTIALGIAGSAAAAGSSDGTGTGPSQAQIQKCIDSGTVDGVPPSCTFDSNGNLISRSTPRVLDPGPNLLAPIIIVAIFWSLIPLLIAFGAARSRNEPVGTAVLMTLVLGWVGLIIVLYGQRRAASDLAGLVNRAPPAPSPMAASPAAPAAAAPADGVRERLGTLDGLYAQGVITVDERDRRRAAILDEV